MSRGTALLVVGVLLTAATSARAAPGSRGTAGPACADDCPCGPEDAVRQWWEDRLASIETEEWSPVWIRSAGGYDTALAPRTGTMTILPPERTLLNPNHIKALLLVRDAYVVRLRTLSKTFDEIRDGDLGERRRRQKEADRAAKEIAAAEERLERAETALETSRGSDIESGIPSSPMTEAAEKEAERARAAFEATLQKATLRFPELLVHLDDVPLWRALADADDESEKFDTYEEYLSDGADQLSDLADEVERYDRLEQLWPLAGLESVRNEIVLQSELFGIPLLAGYMHALEGVWDQQGAIEEYEKLVFSNVMLGISVIAIPLGPLVCAGVTAIDVVMVGDELQIRLLDAEQARASAPVTGAEHLARVETALDNAQVDAGFALVGVVLDAPDVVRAIKGVRVVPPRPRPCPERPRTGGDPPPLVRGDPPLEEPRTRVMEDGPPERPITDPDDEPIVILDDEPDVPPRRRGDDPFDPEGGPDGETPTEVTGGPSDPPGGPSTGGERRALPPELPGEIIDEDLLANLQPEEAERLGELVARGQREGLDPVELSEVEELVDEARRTRAGEPPRPRTGGERVDLPPNLPNAIVDEGLFAHLPEGDVDRLAELLARGQRDGLTPEELAEVEELLEKARGAKTGAPLRPRTGGERVDLPPDLPNAIVDEGLFAHLPEGDVDRLAELLERGQREGLTPEELAEVEELLTEARRARTAEEARARPRTGDPDGPPEEPIVDPDDEPIVIVGEDAHRRITGEPPPRRAPRTGREGDPASAGESGGSRAARELAKKGAQEGGRQAARSGEPADPETVEPAEEPGDADGRGVDPAGDGDEKVSARPRTGGEGTDTAVAMTSIPGDAVDPVDPIDFTIVPRGGDGPTATTLDPVALISEITPGPVRTGSRDPTVQLMILEGRTLSIPPAGDGAPDRRVPGGGLGPDPDLLLHLVSEGGTGAGAMRILGANGRGAPVSIDGGALVVEPVELGREVRDRVLGEVRDLARGNPWTAAIDAYCAEFDLQPPTPGAVFRIAGQELQRRFAPLRSVLDASRRLREAGLLTPDAGDPEAYFHSIRQWAIWALEEELDREGFEEAVVGLARRNLAARDGEWTDAIETAVRSVVPKRWEDVRRILDRRR